MSTITIKPSEASTEAELERLLTKAVQSIRASIRRGEVVTVSAESDTMTTQQAADFMGFSRPTLIRKLDEFNVPYTKVGRHRRIKVVDLKTFRALFEAERLSTIREVQRLSGEAGEYDYEGPNPLIH